MGFEHTPAGVWFHHNLRILYRVSFGDVHLEVNMIPGEPEIPKLIPIAFHPVERLCTRLNVLLFSEAVVPVFGDEKHGHPVIAGVTRNLFRASANCIIQNISRSCRTIRGQAALPAACDKDM